MTSSSPVRVPPAVQIPELGPWLGRIPLSAGSGSAPIQRLPLDSIRLDLATAIFELAADARSWSSAGDRQAAVDELGRSGWLAAWEAAVRGAAEVAVQAIDARIREAGQESRIPGRKLKRLFLSDPEKRALAARLGRGGFAFAEGLEPVDREGHRLREAGVLDREAGDRWREALTGAARSLEAAWLTLEEAATEEWHRWSPLVESVRTWRRPRWVLWGISAIVLAVLVYVGLVVGGYLQGPQFLEAFADWWWTWWDRLVEPA
jgi:hypothetical protein